MLAAEDVRKMEEIATSYPPTWEKLELCKAIAYIAELERALSDPNYMYSGRIHRQAILCRNAEIDVLRKEVAELKTKLNS